MIMQKENVVRYTVEIEAEKKFKDSFEIMEYIENLFKENGMQSEFEKMRKKGWRFREVERNSYFTTYHVEYTTKTAY